MRYLASTLLHRNCCVRRLWKALHVPAKRRMQTSLSRCEVFEAHAQARAVQEGSAPKESRPKKHSSCFTGFSGSVPAQAEQSILSAMPSPGTCETNSLRYAALLTYPYFVQADVRPVGWILQNRPFRDRVLAPQTTVHAVLAWVGNPAGVHL